MLIYIYIYIFTYIYILYACVQNKEEEINKEINRQVRRSSSDAVEAVRLGAWRRRGSSGGGAQEEVQGACGATVVQEVEKSFSNQKVASSIPCRSVLEQDTEPLIAPDVQCAISVNVKCVYIVSRTYVSRFG